MASPGDEVSIRGLNEGRMVIEIDGRRINQTGHYGRYIVDWSTLNLDDIESIEIIRGGHSVLHPFAIGGVINMITKKGKKTDDPKPDVSLKGGYGRYDTYNVSGSVDGGVGNVVGYHFSASRGDTDGYLRNDFQRTDNLNGHLSFFLPRNATFTVGAKYSDVHYGFAAAMAALGKSTIPAHDIRFVIQSAPFSLMGWSMKDRQLLKDLAKYESTMVFYMALWKPQKVFAVLQEVLPPDMPCAVVYWAGYPDRERILRGTVADMGEKLAKDKERFMGLLFIGRFLEGKPYESAMKLMQK